MKEEDLKTITLQTAIYHPFLGKGLPIAISEQTVTVEFENGIVVYGKTYGYGECKGLEHIFLHPVKIVNA